MQEFIDAYVMDCSTYSTFGINVDSINNPDHPLVINGKKAFNTDANFSRIVSVLAPKVARYFRLEFMDKDMLDYFGNLVNETVTNIGSPCPDKPYFLQMMAEKVNDKQSSTSSPNEQGKKRNKYLTLDELTAQAIVLFIGGFDSTVSTLTHILYYLSKYPSIQQKVYEEIRDVTDFSNECLSQLKYLNAVINESHRLKPTVLSLFRICVKDTQLSGINYTFRITLLKTIHHQCSKM